ncbi:MAG: glycosyl transferase [Butyrivibrio sp.]|nr:glycosyl transferase [Butyrivibrio sp.]
MHRLVEYIKNPKLVLLGFLNNGILNWLSDEKYLKYRFRICVGNALNIDNPVSFNEKLQWLKLNDRKPIYTMFVDKYEVKKYVARTIGKEYIIPTYGVWEHFDDIDFDSLPRQFVLKCTHDSGGIIIVRNKQDFNRKAAKRKIERCLRKNFYYVGREWPYKNVKPRIIAEKYMEEKNQSQIYDYKIFNFDGEPKIIQVDYDRFKSHKRNLYNTNWDYIKAAIEFPTDENRVINKPQSLNEMLVLARKLSKKIPHVRTDFYEIDGHVYFGELTLYHGSGFERFTPESFGVELGKMLKLPNENTYD